MEITMSPTAYVGAGYAVALHSCTAALYLAMIAIGLKSGDLD